MVTNATGVILVPNRYVNDNELIYLLLFMYASYHHLNDILMYPFTANSKSSGSCF